MGVAAAGGAGAPQSAFSNPQILSALLPNYNIAALDNALQAELTAAAAPLSNISQQISGLQSQITAWQGLQSDLTAVQSDAQALAGSSLYQGIAASSNAPTAVAASAAGTGSPGTYQVGVSQLMQPEIVNSGVQSSATASLGYSGTIGLDGVSVSISPSNSLQNIASAINAAGTGVTATVLGSGSGDVLKLASSSGTPITWSDPNAILQKLGVLGSTGSPANLVQAAQPALYTINGVSEQSPTDTSTAIPGVTLSFLSTTGATPATVTVAQNQQAIISRFQQLASDVNTLIAAINQYAGPGGVLEGNASVLGIADSLQQALGIYNPSNPPGYQALSQIGVTLSAPVGAPSKLQMSVSTATLQQALQGNAAAVALLLNGSTGSIAQQLVAELNSLVGTDGSLTQQISALQTQQTTISSEINNPNSAVNMMVSSQQQSLQTDFQNMLQALLTSQTQGDQITQFLNVQYGKGGQSGG